MTKQVGAWRVYWLSRIAIVEGGFESSVPEGQP